MHEVGFSQCVCTLASSVYSTLSWMDGGKIKQSRPSAMLLLCILFKAVQGACALGRSEISILLTIFIKV